MIASTKVLSSLTLAGVVLAACGGSSTDSSQAEYVYDGACTKEACADLQRPDTDCTETAPLFKCSAAADGQCAFSYTCPSKDDPGAAVSFSPCDDAACGPKPTTGAEAGCAEGTEYTGATCGRLNNAKSCKWEPGCAKLGKPIPVDPSKVGAACGIEGDVVQQCPQGEECLVLPLETGVRGAHCFTDACSLLGCPGNECITLDSFPGQISCMR